MCQALYSTLVCCHQLRPETTNLLADGDLTFSPQRLINEGGRPEGVAVSPVGWLPARLKAPMRAQFEGPGSVQVPGSAQRGAEAGAGGQPSLWRTPPSGPSDRGCGGSWVKDEGWKKLGQEARGDQDRKHPFPLCWTAGNPALPKLHPADKAALMAPSCSLPSPPSAPRGLSAEPQAGPVALGGG